MGFKSTGIGPAGSCEVSTGITAGLRFLLGRGLSGVFMIPLNLSSSAKVFLTFVCCGSISSSTECALSNA